MPTAASSTQYRERFTTLLSVRTNPSAPLALDLYAGCGGLSLGFAAAGFRTLGVETDADACRTYSQNVHGGCRNERIDRDTLFPSAEVLIAAPPCQPFSMSGLKRGNKDERDGFPAVLAAIRRVRPRVAVIENVPSMATEHADYLNHLRRGLRRLGYRTTVDTLNAAEFGVPQNRRRLFLVAHKGRFEYPAGIGMDAPTVRDALGSMASPDAEAGACADFCHGRLHPAV